MSYLNLQLKALIYILKALIYTPINLSNTNLHKHICIHKLVFAKPATINPIGRNQFDGSQPFSNDLSKSSVRTAPPSPPTPGRFTVSKLVDNKVRGQSSQVRVDYSLLVYQI